MGLIKPNLQYQTVPQHERNYCLSHRPNVGPKGLQARIATASSMAGETSPIRRPSDKKAALGTRHLLV
jgi:hypothetical protein